MWQELKTWEKGNSLVFYAIIVAAGGCLLYWVCSCVARKSNAKKRTEAVYYGYDAFYAGGRGSRSRRRDDTSAGYSYGRGGRDDGRSSLDPRASFFPGDIPEHFGSGRTTRYGDRYDDLR